ncbi:MAG: hypothetical protein COT18_06100 [Elusimicrobia bacterium CG08_land_8_20_14_0_20_59_10]|nr:MAG: hypothetical protein COT18_06100 [Elusimicrobia bacterium CG08_land_8_20_14_0_20_59_10]
MDKKADSALNSFYYLSPLWCVLELFFWPGFRAGVVTGSGAAGTAAFYAVEAGLGAALWFRLPYANAGALVENIVYLVFVLKFLMLTPLDIAIGLGDGAPGAEALARNYSAAVPGIIYSSFHVVYRIKKALRRD